MPWCELCSPKADNISMAVVVGYYSGIRAMDPTRCASEDAGPLRGGLDEGIPHRELKRTNHAL